MHPLLSLIATRPQLLADHAQAYADLVAAELPRATMVWKRQVLLQGLGFASLGLALLLSGMALMLWGTLPPATMAAPWLLWAVPGLFALTGLLLCLAARRSVERDLLQELRQQISADMAMWREATP